MDSKVNKLFDKLSEKYKDDLENAKIKPIHPDFQFAQNGICAMIGVMNSGKSYNYLKMATKQQYLFDEPFFELIVISSTSGEFDKTLQTFRQAISKSNVETVKDDDLIEFLNDYTSKVQIYNTIMQFVKNGLKEPSNEMMKLLKENACIDRKGNIDILRAISYISNKLTEYGWKSYPHRMLLIMDDYASNPLLKKKENPLPRLLKKLRHFNINVIICVQTTMSIPKDIKRILSDCILWPGISINDFKDLVKDSSLSCFDPDELWQEYSKINNKHTMFILHITARKIKIQEPK